jgi:hypothetical protein
MNDEGWYVTANVLGKAAEEIKELRAEIERLKSQPPDTCSCTDHCKSEFTRVLYPKCIPSARPDFEPRSPYD